MRFRDFTVDYPKPYRTDKWIYSESPIYENIENCFLDTQRPEDKWKEKGRLRDPFRKINKHKIQEYLHHSGPSYKELDWVEDDNGVIRAIILYYDISKMSAKKKTITSFTGDDYTLTETDTYIKEVACYAGYEDWLRQLIEKHESLPSGDTFFDFDEPLNVIESDMQLGRIRELLKSMGYECKDNLITSFADMFGIWFKGGDVSGLDDAERLSLQRLDIETQDTRPLMEQVLKLQEGAFANHYSNYNKSSSWSGIVVRGYGGKEDFIIKPAEMTQSWKKDNPEKMDWVVEDTPLRGVLTEVEKFVDLLPFEKERIRILKLSQGEGELKRHTDRQDKDAGLKDGMWTRLHFPLQTNEGVIFTQWNSDGSKTVHRMGEGELHYLDMRKPHTAINHGAEDRYHLVIDVKSTPELRKWLVDSSKKYPTTSEPDDYIE